MSDGLRRAPLDSVRCVVADLVTGTESIAPDSVGEIALWPHQRDAVVRLHAAIREFGGALLADDVGTGKTFAALAVASRYRTPLVVAPAALRDRWRDAAARARRETAFISFESLSRNATLQSTHDFVIVDEAHHARNPATKRYAALAALIADTPALLLTATPIHNRRADILSLLALFLGTAASSLDDASLARCVVRRGREVFAGGASLPVVRGPIPIHCQPISDETPGAIMSLPPPVPAADAGIASALLAISLLRQWSSSQGALLAAIRRRLAAAHALASTLDAGHYPTRTELASWTADDDVQQVVMTELLAPVAHPAAATELRAAITAHINGLRVIRRAATADASLDERRAVLLRDVRRSHAGERAIAFSQFAGTIDAYWRELRLDAGVCALTADRARVASGVVSRAEALGSFVPCRLHRGSRAFAIDALLVTDLASEGLDLHDASVLVHLDLPWTPARLEQRVGRIVRPGSPHNIVHVYTMEPPLRAAAYLDIRRTLSAKLAAARATLGSVMPGLGIALEAVAPPDLTAAVPAATEATLRILERWRSANRAIGGRGMGADDHPVVAVASGSARAWLAVVGDAAPRLVAFADGTASDDPATIARVVTLVDVASEGDSGDADSPGVADPAIERAISELAAWSDARRGASLAGVGDIALVRGRRRALAAIARIAAAPASSRARAAPVATRALAVAARPLGASRERDLREMTHHAGGDDLAFFAALSRLGPNSSSRPDVEAAVRALVVLVPAR